MSSVSPTDSAREARPAGIQFSLRRLLFWILFISIAMALLVAFGNALRTARRAALATASQGPLNQLLLALHNYHDVHGHFPPAYIADDKGTPIHSWRVLVLPYIEHQALYEAYDFSEPWNGPNNSKLADRMPRVFCSPSEGESRRFTNIVAITGSGTAFPGPASTSVAEFVDGRENTILLTEIANSNLPWLQPRDIDTREGTFPTNQPDSLGISSVAWRNPYVVFADGIHAYAVRKDMPPESLKALTTIAGHEPITRSRLIRQGYLK